MNTSLPLGRARVGGIGRVVLAAVATVLGLAMALVGALFAVSALIVGAAVGLAWVLWSAVRGRPAIPLRFGVRPRAGSRRAGAVRATPWAGEVVDVQAHEVPAPDVRHARHD